MRACSWFVVCFLVTRSFRSPVAATTDTRTAKTADSHRRNSSTPLVAHPCIRRPLPCTRAVHCTDPTACSTSLRLTNMPRQGILSSMVPLIWHSATYCLSLTAHFTCQANPPALLSHFPLLGSGPPSRGSLTWHPAGAPRSALLSLICLVLHGPACLMFLLVLSPSQPAGGGPH